MRKATTSTEVNQLNSIFNYKESHDEHLKDSIMSCGDEAIALAKNEIICVSEFEAYLKYYYYFFNYVMLIPSKYLLDDRFIEDHIYIIYYIFY